MNDFRRTPFRAAQRWSIQCEIPGVDPWLIIQSIANHPIQGIVCFVYLQAQVPDYQRNDPEMPPRYGDESRSGVPLTITAAALEKSVGPIIEEKTTIATYTAFSEFQMRPEDWGDPPWKVSEDVISVQLKTHFESQMALYLEWMKTRDSQRKEYKESLTGLLEDALLEQVIPIFEDNPLLIDAPLDSWSKSRPLHVAGSVDLARWLIGHGADVNAAGDQGERPLHHAARYGHVDMAQLLIESGADINATDEMGFTPLFTATRGREPECALVANLLEQCGATIDFNTAVCLQRPELIRRFMQDSDAVKKARFPDFLVEDMVLLIQCRIWKELTPPFTAPKARAIVRENLGTIEQLLNMGANANSRSALFYAVQLPDPYVAELLLQRGADPNRDIHQGIYMTEIAQAEEMRTLLRRYGVFKLVYYEVFDDIENAIVREKRLKKWNRAWKVRKIETHNPNWDDLWPGIAAP